MRIEIYSDVSCPWCYIGERRLTRALAALPGGAEIDVVFRPYQLDPAAPATATPVARYLERRFGRPAAPMLARVTEAAAAEGITMDWDKAQAVNTRAALRLAWLAEREYGAGVQRALVERLFDAHFTRGLDVGDRATLVELAAAAGVDADRARAWLELGEGDDELGAELEEARAIGVRAVPTFVIDGALVIEGAQPASIFLQVLEEARRRSASGGAPDAQGGDPAAVCGGDGCVIGAGAA